MCPSDCFLPCTGALAENKGSPSPGLYVEGYQGNNGFSDQFLFERLKKKERKKERNTPWGLSRKEK